MADRKPKVKDEPQYAGPIFGASGPSVTLGGGTAYKLAVLPFATQVAYQEIFLVVLPETGQFDGPTEGDIIINGLMLSRAFGRLGGILQRFILDLPDGVVEASSRGELVEAVNVIFRFNGYQQAQQIIKNLAALASTAIQTGMDAALARVQPELNEEATRLIMRGLNDAESAKSNPSETTGPDGSDSGPASMTAA